MDSKEKPRYFIHSLAKGLRTIQVIAEAGRPLSISEIAGFMNTNTTSIIRFCYTLSQLGFLERDNQKQYRLTPKILSLGYPEICSFKWEEIAKHFIEELYQRVQETVNLTILDGSEVLFIYRIRKLKYLSYDIRVGTKLPVHCTASGKVFMAFCPPDKVAPIITGLEFQPITQFTITSRERYMRELEEVRRKGYAVNDQELSTAIRTIAAPIFAGDGFPLAALHVSVPTVRFSREKMEEDLAPKIVEAGKQITDALSKSATC